MLGNQFGFRCPECGDDERISVVAKIMVDLTPDGSVESEELWDGHEWDGDSPVRCRACDWSGKIDYLVDTLFLCQWCKREWTLDEIRSTEYGAPLPEGSPVPDGTCPDERCCSAYVYARPYIPPGKDKP